MDIFPSFPSLLWSLPEIHQVSVEVGSMCAENTRWNSQGIQRGIFIRAWYKWCTSKCVRLDSLGENSIDIISITILTRLHPLTLINEKRYRRLLIIARLRRMPDRNLCIVHRESFSRDGSRVVEESSSIEACLSIMHRACAIMTLTLEEKLSAEWRF